VIRDVAQLREHGQVERCVDELDVDVDTWRAGMRAAARREGMRIRTFVVEPGDPLVTSPLASTPAPRRRRQRWCSRCAPTFPSTLLRSPPR
jgi:hypothetical protein